MNKIQFIFVHHTAVSYNINPDQWNQTNDFHKQRGFPVSSLGFFVGYNYEISKDGKVRQARMDGEETAAVKGYNFCSLSICLDGNFDIELPTPMQVMALKNLLRDRASIHNVPVSSILPHRHFANKSCYGSRLADNWAQGLVGPLDTQISLLSVQRFINALKAAGVIPTTFVLPIASGGGAADNRKDLEAV